MIVHQKKKKIKKLFYLIVNKNLYASKIYSQITFWKYCIVCHIV